MRILLSIAFLSVHVFAECKLLAADTLKIFDGKHAKESWEQIISFPNDIACSKVKLEEKLQKMCGSENKFIVLGGMGIKDSSKWNPCPVATQLRFFPSDYGIFPKRDTTAIQRFSLENGVTWFATYHVSLLNTGALVKHTSVTYSKVPEKQNLYYKINKKYEAEDWQGYSLQRTNAKGAWQRSIALSYAQFLNNVQEVIPEYHISFLLDYSPFRIIQPSGFTRINLGFGLGLGYTNIVFENNNYRANSFMVPIQGYLGVQHRLRTGLHLMTRLAYVTRPLQQDYNLEQIQAQFSLGWSFAPRI